MDELDVDDFGLGDGNIESSEGESGESDPDDGNHDQVQDDKFHWAYGRIDEKHHAADMIVNSRKSCIMTRTAVRSSINECEKMMQARTINLKLDVSDYLTRNGLINEPQSVLLLDKFNCQSPFKSWKSNPGQIKAISSYYHYVDPITGFLGCRIQPVNVGDNVFRQLPVQKTFQYMSLKETLKLIARKQSVLEYMRTLRPRNDDYLTCYTDGDSFATHPFFSKHPDAFQLGLYYDDVEVVNAKGSKCGVHTLGCFYIKVLNVPHYINSKLSGYHIIALARTEDIKSAGFRPFLQPFLDELRELETEEGVIEFIGDRRVALRASLAAVLGDTKGVHEILGFLASGARHFCRLCLVSRDDLHTGNVVLGQQRCEALHQEHLQTVAANPAHSLFNGVKENSCLHQSNYFHATRNYCFDSQHDIAEGFGMMDVKLVLQEYICVQHYFTAVDFNRRLKAFNYGGPDRCNKPSPNFSAESLQKVRRANYKLLQTSSQMFCLFRVLPFILDNLGVPDDDPYLDLLLILQKIVEIVKAPKLTRSILPYLRRLQEDHRRLFKELFPNVNPINKNHHAEHYDKCIQEMGPLEQYECMRGEGKHRPLKRQIVTCGSYREVTKTAVEYGQISQAYAWTSEHPNVVPKFELPFKTQTVVNNCHTAGLLTQRGFQPNEMISKVKSVTVYGLEYRLHDFVVIRTAVQNESEIESFGQVVGIISANEDSDVWFEIEEWETVALSQHLNAYIVSRPNYPTVHLLDAFDLPQHPPMSLWHDYSTFNSYLSLRHIVL